MKLKNIINSSKQGKLACREVQSFILFFIIYLKSWTNFFFTPHMEKVFKYFSYLPIYQRYLNLVKLYTLTHAHTLKTHTLILHIKNIRGTKTPYTVQPALKFWTGQGHLPISEASAISTCFSAVLKIWPILKLELVGC